MSTMPRKLNISHYMPEDHGTHVDFIAPWAKAVEKASAGALSLEVHTGANALGKLDNQYTQVLSGAVDVAHSPAALPVGRFPLTSLMNLPFLADSSSQGTRLLNALLEPHLAREFRGLKVLGLHVDSGSVLHTRDELVTRLEQLKGLRLRCSAGPMEAALHQLGAEPVPLTPPNVRQAAEEGRLDGAVMAWDALLYSGTADIFHHHTRNSLCFAPLYFVMNGETWKSLDDRERDAVERCSGAVLARQFPLWWSHWEAPGLTHCQAPGHVMGALAPDELQRWREAAAPAVEAHIEALAAGGHPEARAVYQAALTLRRQ